MPVYVDVLLIVNAFVNYLMLVLSEKYLNFTVKRLRLLAACAVGSIFSLRIFLPEIPLPLEFLLRAAMCTVISLAAFGFIHIKTFLRNTCVFFTVNLLFGGLISAILFFFDTGLILYRNGAFYFDIDLKILAVTSVISFAAVNAVSVIVSKKTPKETVCAVTVYFRGEACTGRGFFDTGNALHDVFSGFPVIIAQYDAVKKILPEEIEIYLHGGFSEKIRLIPVSGVGGDEILPAFRPDGVSLKSRESEKNFSDVYIAVSRRSFFGGEFEFILNNELTGDMTNENNKKTKNTAYETAEKKQYLLHKRPRDAACSADKG